MMTWNFSMALTLFADVAEASSMRNDVSPNKAAVRHASSEKTALARILLKHTARSLVTVACAKAV